MTQSLGVPAHWIRTWRLPLVVGLIVLGVHGVSGAMWLERNPFPDGAQNEYLHVGNAYDLWGALIRWDWWHLRYYPAHSYWPPGYAVATWPLLAAFGAARDVLVFSNLFWLALAFVGVAGLSRAPARAALAIGILGLCPGVFGPLLRFEPNIAQLAMVACLLWAVDRNALGSRKGALAVGALLGVALLVDRLATVPLVAGAFGWWAWSRRDRPDELRALLWLVLAASIVAGPWYLQWAQGQWGEIGAQLGGGEIDAAGHRTEGTTPFSFWTFVYYPLVLLDSQAGPVLGLAMFVALVVRPRRDLAGTVLVAWVLFTLVQKKQVFYTLPVLVPLSVLLADLVARLSVRRARLLIGVLVALGVHQFGVRQWGVAWPASAVFGQPDPLPAGWVAPRHAVSRPPSDIQFPFDAVLQAAGGAGAVVIFSEGEAFYEGFIELGLRAVDLERRVIGVQGNPLGCYEDFRHADAFVVVSSGHDWPTSGALVGALVRDHYDLDALPPVVETIEADQVYWASVWTYKLGTGDALTVWRRQSSSSGGG